MPAVKISTLTVLKDLEGNDLPDSKRIMLNEQMAIDVPIGDDGKPIYLGEDEREPRPLTMRWALYKALIVGIDPLTQPEEDKPTSFKIAADAMAHDEITLTHDEVTFVTRITKKRCDSIVWGRINEVINPELPAGSASSEVPPNMQDREDD